MLKRQTAQKGREATSLTTKPPSPLRGEVWLINLDPTIGAEIKKTRPAIVISSDSIGILPIKLVVPLTEWRAAFVGHHWHVKVLADASNGLDKDSAADCLQVRGVDTARFVKRFGRVASSVTDEIAIAIAIVVEYD